MSWENRGTDVSFVAGENLSSAQYRFMELNSSGQAMISGGTGIYALGVLQNTPTEGQAADVRVDGITKLAMGSTGIYGVTGVALGTIVANYSKGRAVGETGAGYTPAETKARMLNGTLTYDQYGTAEIISANPA